MYCTFLFSVGFSFRATKRKKYMHWYETRFKSSLKPLVLVSLISRGSLKLTLLTYQPGLLPELSSLALNFLQKRFQERVSLFRGFFELRCFQLL